MRGSLSTAPLRDALAARLRTQTSTADLIRAWVDRFPETNPVAIARFLDRVLTGASPSITRDRADEAALVLGLMPTDLWGEAWWGQG